MALLLDCAAGFRLTRLLVEDDVLSRPRYWLAKRSEWLGRLLSCPWCVSVWVGFGVVAARRLAPRAWGEVVAPALAVSAATGLVSERL